MKKMYSPIKLILADDHELFRDGFSAMIKKYADIELIGEARDGQDLINITRLLKPDVIVTDISMPGTDGINASKIILHEFPNIKIIALSMFNEDHLIVKMMEAGARGYLLKNAHKDEIIDAIETVYKGDNYYCKDTSAKLVKLLSYSHFTPVGQKSKPLLSLKELAIIRLICKLYSSRQIADELNLSVRTIDSYRKNILEKLNTKSAVGIAMYAVKNKICNPDDIEINTKKNEG